MSAGPVSGTPAPRDLSTAIGADPHVILNPEVEVSSTGTRDSPGETFSWIDRGLKRQQPQALSLGFQLRRSCL
jgi:hypothetical protein